MELKKFYFGLDFVKVVAILGICLFHYLDFNYYWQLGSVAGYSFTSLVNFTNSESPFRAIIEWLFLLGVFGVYLFIIASGFGLMNSKVDSYWAFIKNRIFKIVPFYWFILSIVFVYNLIFDYKNVDFWDYLAHYFFINNFFPDYVLSISAPFWFISTIIQLYLIFPFLKLFLQKFGAVWLMILAIALKLFLDPYLVSINDGGRFFTEFIIEFSFGMVMFTNLERFENINFKLVILAFLVSVLAVFFVDFPSIDSWAYIAYNFISLLFFVFIYLVGERFFAKGRKFIIHLSKLSFAIFLSHHLFLVNFYRYVETDFSRLLNLLIYLLAILVLAYVTDRSFNFAKIIFQKLSKN